MLLSKSRDKRILIIIFIWTFSYGSFFITKSIAGSHATFIGCLIVYVYLEVVLNTDFFKPKDIYGELNPEKDVLPYCPICDNPINKPDMFCFKCGFEIKKT